MSFRWLYDSSTSGPFFNNMPGFDRGFTGKTMSGLFSDTYTFNPRLTNEFRFNYSTTKAGKYFELDDFGGAESFDDSLVFPLFSSAENSLYRFSLGGNTAFSVGKDATNFQHQVNLVDSLTILSGSHQVKIGVDYRRLTPVYGQWKYKQFASFDSVAEALSGIASSVAIQTQDKVSLVFTNFSGYAQDVWKLSRRLTVTHDELREGANDELYGGWPMILSGLKTYLETGELLTTPGSLMYATPARSSRKR